jgi:hypothetical protein
LHQRLLDRLDSYAPRDFARSLRLRAWLLAGSVGSLVIMLFGVWLTFGGAALVLTCKGLVIVVGFNMMVGFYSLFVEVGRAPFDGHTTLGRDIENGDED